MTEPASPLPALKPCPFCGERSAIGLAPRLGGRQARCSGHSCWADGPIRNTDEDAAAIWNAAPRHGEDFASVDAPATPLPALLPCPACGAGAFLNGDEHGWWIECASREGDEVRCWRGPSRDEEREARDAWNALPRLADGLRPEAPAPPDVAASVAWLCRALTTLALRHGVTLPPFPRRPT